MSIQRNNCFSHVCIFFTHCDPSATKKNTCINTFTQLLLANNLTDDNPLIPSFPVSVYQSNNQHKIKGYTREQFTKLNVRFSQHQLTKHQQNLIYDQSRSYGYQQNIALYNRWLDQYKPKLHTFDVNLTVSEDAAVVSCVILCLDTMFHFLSYVFYVYKTIILNRN